MSVDKTDETLEKIPTVLSEIGTKFKEETLEKTCARCGKKLGIRRHRSQPYWGFQKTICNECNKHIQDNILDYDVKCVGDEQGFKIGIEMSGKLYLQRFDEHSIVFVPEKEPFIKIPTKQITNIEVVEKYYLKRKKPTKFLQIEFKEYEKEKNLLFTSKKLNEIIDDAMILTPHLTKKIQNKSMIKEIKNSKTDEELEILKNTYGRVIKETPSGQYYGGHKAYLAGGTFGDAQNGKLILTEKYLLFFKNAMRESKRWKIVIPLEKIIIEDWKIDEKVRRKTAAGGGLAFGIFGGAGTIHDTGKAHDIVVPYVDENGITQAPRFGVVSLSGNAIREWAKIIYDQLVLVHKVTQTQESESSENNQNNSEDPVQLLKIRLAKGEITKEEFEELRKLLES